MIYGSKFKTLSYAIKWDDAALASYFYEKLKNRVKDAMVAMDRPESLQRMIKVAVKIDDRQHDRFIDKKTWSKPVPKNKYQFKKDPMELDATEEKRFRKKNCYVCGKLGHLKRNCPKKTIKMSEEWIEMTEKPETVTKINHENLSWTACSNDECRIHKSFKENVKWYLKKKKMFKRKPNISYRLYPTKTPVRTVMIFKIGKLEIPGMITENTENTMSTSFAERIKNYLDTKCTRNNEGIIQHVTIESKHGFIKTTSFRLKSSSKNLVVFGQQWKKNINAQDGFQKIKKQKMSPQTVHMLAYRNAIVNELKST